MSRESMGNLGGRKPANQGFTLIEMSIVLAIIGLIVGGILKGQEVVNNGRLKMQVAQMDAIKAAIFTFQDQFTYLPGDYPNAGAQLGLTSTANGNGDGVIGKVLATGSNPSAATLSDKDDTSGTESVLAWADLIAANLLQGVTLPSGQNLSSVASTTNLSYPGKMSSTFLWIGTFNASSASIAGPMIRLQQPISGALSSASGQSVRETDAYNLDRKYDDGSPITGSILVDSISDTSNCANAGTYTLPSGASPNTNWCTLLWVVQ